MKESQRKTLIKTLVICWVTIAIVAIIYAVVINISRAGKRNVMVKCAPYTAKVYIDKKSVSNNASIFVEDGEHEVLCFLPGFEIENKTINVDSGAILVELLPTTSEGRTIQQERMKDYYDLESYAGKSSNQGEMAKIDEKAKLLLKFLPYNTDNFGLGMQTDESGATVTISTWKPGYTQMAINKLLSLAKNADVSLAGYGFRINEFTNQLQEFQDNSSENLAEYIQNGYKNTGLKIEINRTGEIESYHFALISVPQPTIGRVTYRALFKIEDNRNKLISTPYPILTTSNTPGVEIEVLNALNDTAEILEGNT